MRIMRYKLFYLLFSALILVPGIVFLLLSGLKLSIDFTGGSLFRYEFSRGADVGRLRAILESKGVAVESISREAGNVYTVRTKSVDVAKGDDVKAALLLEFPGFEQLSFQTVGPSIGQETTKRAFLAVIWASLAILLYIAFAFRNIPKPYSSFRFGISAIIAMFHDALVVLGLFAVLGHFLNVEIDSLFITAVLTVIGFSVHDTIVVFDRIRENLKKLPQSFGFESIVDYSIVETLGRSVATSMTVIITLLALFILGGESIKYFVLAMLVGIISGTYSSIFNATPILVIWENFVSKKRKA